MLKSTVNYGFGNVYVTVPASRGNIASHISRRRSTRLRAAKNYSAAVAGPYLLTPQMQLVEMFVNPVLLLVCD